MTNHKHQYHGTILYRITQHGLHAGNQSLDDRTYLINDRVVVYFKYATQPRNGAYQFTFTLSEIDNFLRLEDQYGYLCLVLFCALDDETCCLTLEDFLAIWERRQNEAGDLEDQFTLKLTLPAGKSFRVSADHPGRRCLPLGKPLLIPRTDFPNRIFQGATILPIA